MGMGRGAGDLDHVSQAWPAGMAWPRAPSKFAMYRENDFLLEIARSQAWLAGLAWPRAPSTFPMYRKNELL